MTTYARYTVACTFRICFTFGLLTVIYDWYFPTILIVVMAVFNDGAMIALSKDRVTPSRVPNRWNLSSIFISGAVYGLYLTCVGLLFVVVVVVVFLFFFSLLFIHFILVHLFIYSFIYIRLFTCPTDPPPAPLHHPTQPLLLGLLLALHEERLLQLQARLGLARGRPGGARGVVPRHAARPPAGGYRQRHAPQLDLPDHGRRGLLQAEPDELLLHDRARLAGGRHGRDCARAVRDRAEVHPRRDAPRRALPPGASACRRARRRRGAAKGARSTPRNSNRPFFKKKL